MRSQPEILWLWSCQTAEMTHQWKQCSLKLWARYHLVQKDFHSNTWRFQFFFSFFHTILLFFLPPLLLPLLSLILVFLVHIVRLRHCEFPLPSSTPLPNSALLSLFFSFFANHCPLSLQHWGHGCQSFPIQEWRTSLSWPWIWPEANSL